MDAELVARGESTLPKLLRHWAATKGQVIALQEKNLGIWQPVTWRQYYERSRLIALGLARLGLQRGDRIIIASEDTPEWFYSDIGAQMLGVQVVGIYPTNPWPELQYITRHCGAKVAICGDQEQTDKVLEAMAKEGGLPNMEHVFCVDMKGLRHYAPGRPTSFDDLIKMGEVSAKDPLAVKTLDESIESATPDDINVLVYTSGTTGHPKGAQICHRNFIYSAAGYAQRTGMTERHFESICYLPLCHAAERCYGMVMHLVLGGRVNFAESIDTVTINVREIAPTFFLGVPRIWEKLQEGFSVKMRESAWLQRKVYAWAMRKGRELSDERASHPGRVTLLEKWKYRVLYLALFRHMQRHMGLNRTHTRLCSGASVSPETLRFFDIIGLPVGQGYGMTETAGLSMGQGIERPWTIGSSGHALRGTEWKLAADSEIMVRSPGVFRGYFRDKAGTDAVLSPDGWLSTGDIGEIVNGDEVAIVDRKKAIIITSGGKNIAPSEIENALKDSIYVRETIVVGEARKFLGALIQIDFEAVGQWASDHDLQYTTYKSLTQLPEVRELIEGLVNAVNRRFARVENIRKFVLLEKELDHDDGELTATQKVRRGLINQKFSKELQLIYGESS